MSGPIVQPYLFFGGRCEEALAFYGAALGATIDMKMYFHQSPMPMPPGILAPGFENKVMHATFRIADTVMYASDGCAPGQKYDGFSLSITMPTVAEAEATFAKLAEGGKVTMPLSKTFWAESYGMVTDQFGIGWMVQAPLST